MSHARWAMLPVQRTAVCPPACRFSVRIACEVKLKTHRSSVEDAHSQHGPQIYKGTTRECC